MTVEPYITSRLDLVAAGRFTLAAVLGLRTAGPITTRLAAGELHTFRADGHTFVVCGQRRGPPDPLFLAALEARPPHAGTNGRPRGAWGARWMDLQQIIDASARLRVHLPFTWADFWEAIDAGTIRHRVKYRALDVYTDWPYVRWALSKQVEGLPYDRARPAIQAGRRLFALDEGPQLRLDLDAIMAPGDGAMGDGVIRKPSLSTRP